MRPFRLGARFLFTILGIVLPLHLVTSWIVLEQTRENQQAHAEEMLASGGRIFARLLEDRERKLLESVEVLASDFGLKRAVATADRPTIESAIANHGRRIGAQLTIAADLSGEEIGYVSNGTVLDVRSSALRRLLRTAQEEGRASGVIVDERMHPLQLVIAPVKAPLPVGWMIMGFELDAVLARELRDLTDLEVTFWARADENTPPTVTSTHGRHEEKRFVDALSAGWFSPGSTRERRSEDADWISHSVALKGAPTEKVGAVLQVSRAESMRPYEVLRYDLILVFAGGVALAMFGALATSRRLTEPIAALATATRKIAEGRFDAELDEHGRDEIGELARTFRVMQEAVADREKRILHQSTHDALTGLPNRFAALNTIADAIAQPGRTAVAILDISGLKDINDTLGPAIGDAVLQEIAGRLVDLPALRYVARFGGDEFLVEFDAAPDRDVEADLADIVEYASSPHSVRGAQVVAQLRAGIAVEGEDGDDAEALLRRAEMALSICKEECTRVARYRAGVEETRHRHVGILIELDRAIENDELELHYQPKVDMASRRVIGAEALVRWTHATMGRMNPEEFVSIAEQAGSIEKLSNWVFRTGVEQLHRWSMQGIHLTLSVNLSALDVIQGQLPQLVAESLERWPLGRSALQIEVTESAVISDPDRAAQQLEAIRKLGISVAIDDFGTGHASLAQLRNLPIDEIKIDQMFVRDLREDTVENVIVRSTVDLAHQLGLTAIAEGVEDRISWDILARHGCDAVQGYWISRPVTAADFKVFLDRFEKEGIDD